MYVAWSTTGARCSFSATGPIVTTAFVPGELWQKPLPAHVERERARFRLRAEVRVRAVGARRVAVRAGDPAVVATTVERLLQPPRSRRQPHQLEVRAAVDDLADQVDAVRRDHVRQERVGAQPAVAGGQVGRRRQARAGRAAVEGPDVLDRAVPELEQPDAHVLARRQVLAHERRAGAVRLPVDEVGRRGEVREQRPRPGGRALRGGDLPRQHPRDRQRGHDDEQRSQPARRAGSAQPGRATAQVTASAIRMSCWSQLRLRFANAAMP